MSHNNHQHKFVLKSADHPYYCKRCNQLGFGLSYKCYKNDCNFLHHKECEEPVKLLEYPFSKKCILRFRTDGSGKANCLCDVCGNRINGYHYKCTCTFKKRYVHPSCLSYEQSLAAIDGLTLYLNDEATTKCLHCEKKDRCSKVRGWAYVSSCGIYCYHVSCVMDIINTNWKYGFMARISDPFQSVKAKFAEDMTKRQQLVRGRNNKILTMKKVTTVLSVIFHVLTGNSDGLIGVAATYFRQS